MRKLGPLVRNVYVSIAQRSELLPGKAGKVANFFAKTAERYNLPAWGWGAKGFEFWTFLALLLIRSNASRILELGSGRSTIVFAEYAAFRRAGVTSIETNRKWYNKARMELRWQSLPLDSIQLLAVDPSVAWYDVAVFRAISKARGPFDFVLIDGPNDVAGSSVGFRDGKTAVREIANCCAGADVIIVDDVQRRHVLESVDRMLIEPERYQKYYYRYSVQQHPNALCLCVRRDSRASSELSGLADSLNLSLFTTYSSDLCTED